MNIESIKKFLLELNTQGISIPLIRDPKLGTSSVSLSLVFLSATYVQITLIGSMLGSIKPEVFQNSFMWYVASVGLYFGRNLSVKPNDVKIEEEKK